MISVESWMEDNIFGVSPTSDYNDAYSSLSFYSMKANPIPLHVVFCLISFNFS